MTQTSMTPRQRRLRSSIQVHALHLLALRATHDAASRYWNAILDISVNTTGDAFGTSEGDRIVAKAKNYQNASTDSSFQRVPQILIADLQNCSSPPTSHQDVASGPQHLQRTVRRVGSSASLFQPPRLLRRVSSSASISTVPPNFGRPRALGPHAFVVATAETGQIALNGVVAACSTRRIVSSPLAQGTAVVENTGPYWSLDGFRKGLSGIRRSAVTLLSRSRRVEKDSAALLRKVLERDDASAGPGMYWVEEALVERVAESGCSSHVASIDSPDMEASQRNSTSITPRPRALTRHRSFFDPTTYSPARQISPPRKRSIPQLVCTPATPQKDHLLPPRPMTRRRSRRRSVSSTAATLPPIDPFLAELERTSRVGVKTTCHQCGENGLNYSACPRCRQTFCSRDCRVASGNGRHRCGS